MQCINYFVSYWKINGIFFEVSYSGHNKVNYGLIIDVFVAVFSNPVSG